MSLLEDVFTKFAATAGITAVVGTAPVRIYQDHFPETAARPFICYERSGKDRDTSLNGAVLLAKTTLNIISYADDPDTAEDLSELVEAVVHPAANTTWGSSTIRGSFIQDTDNAYTNFPRGSDLGISSVALVVDVHHVVS